MPNVSVARQHGPCRQVYTKDGGVPYEADLAAGQTIEIDAAMSVILFARKSPRGVVTVVNGGSPKLIFRSPFSNDPGGAIQPNTYFAGATILFLSGANAGVSRTVTTYTNQTTTGEYTLNTALANDIAVGDDFAIYGWGVEDTTKRTFVVST